MKISETFHFATAQICNDGHVINNDIEHHPECNRDFCSECGAKTISACPSCNEPIKGLYFKTEIYQTPRTGVYIPGERHSNTISTNVPVDPKAEYKVPAYCHNCGSPYPWTESLLKEADTIIDSFDELKYEQRKILKERFPDLLSDSSRTISSALIFSKLVNGLTDVGSAVGKGFLINLLEKHIPETIFTLMQLR